MQVQLVRDEVTTGRKILIVLNYFCGISPIVHFDLCLQSSRQPCLRISPNSIVHYPQHF